MASWGAAEATFLLLTATFEVRPCLPHIECIETRACVCGSTFRPRSATIFLSFFLLFSVLCLGVFQLHFLFRIIQENHTYFDQRGNVFAGVLSFPDLRFSLISPALLPSTVPGKQIREPRLSKRI